MSYKNYILLNLIIDYLDYRDNFIDIPLLCQEFNVMLNEILSYLLMKDRYNFFFILFSFSYNMMFIRKNKKNMNQDYNTCRNNQIFKKPINIKLSTFYPQFIMYLLLFSLNLKVGFSSVNHHDSR